MFRIVFWAKTRVLCQTYVQEFHLRALLLTCKGGGSPSLSEDSWGVNCRTGVASVPSEHDMILVSVTVNNYIFHIFNKHSCTCSYRSTNSRFISRLSFGLATDSQNAVSIFEIYVTLKL